MNQAQITTAPQDNVDPRHAHDDAFLSEIDDETLAHALRTVSWHPKDVSQFLRSAANR